MPWRGPEAEEAATGLKFPTLGIKAMEFIESMCIVPDGDQQGEAYRLTDEMLRFLVNYYRLDPKAASKKTGGQRFYHQRGGQLVRPQKWGKGPFSAAIVCFEAVGDAVPDGWDADGAPVGRPWSTPLIQITAVSEDQTANVFRALVPMVRSGPLIDQIPDTGETRINLPGGGRIEPVTASARSRLGQRITLALQDETHSFLQRNSGVMLADNQRRNLAGMGGRFLETTNAWDPTEGSVAQLTNEKPTGVYVDYPTPPPGSVRNKVERRRVLKKVYGDSVHAPKGAPWVPWVDLDRIELDIEALVDRDPAQAERFFLNRVHAAESVAFDAHRWAQLVRKDPVENGRAITIGVDGARTEDALAIIATDVETFHQWPLGIFERPLSAADDYEHDLEHADGVMIDAFEEFDVWRVYCDPQNIAKLIDRWMGRWSDKKVTEWFTNRPRQIAWAVRNYRLAMSTGDLTHNGDPLFARHIANARRMPLNVRDEDGRQMFSLQKDRPHSPNKIDAAMAAILSAEARGDAVAAGVLNRAPSHWFMGV